VERTYIFGLIYSKASFKVFLNNTVFGHYTEEYSKFRALSNGLKAHAY
jgi:hypothetical protein